MCKNIGSEVFKDKSRIPYRGDVRFKFTRHEETIAFDFVTNSTKVRVH